jgi:hypothetical protein
VNAAFTSPHGARGFENGGATNPHDSLGFEERGAANPRAPVGSEIAGTTNPHGPSGFEGRAPANPQAARRFEIARSSVRSSCRPSKTAEAARIMRTASRSCRIRPAPTSEKKKPEGPRSESRPHRAGLIRHRTDSVGKSAPGLGPPRSARHEESGDCLFVRTVDRDRVRRDRSPNGVAWRFPDWTAVGFRLPHEPFDPRDVSRTLFLGSIALHLPLPADCCDAGSDASGIGGLSPRGPMHHWRRL